MNFGHSPPINLSHPSPIATESPLLQTTPPPAQQALCFLIKEVKLSLQTKTTSILFSFPVSGFQVNRISGEPVPPLQTFC